jgi:hypothetical protein
MITPVSFSSIGYKTYVIFAVMCVPHHTSFNKEDTLTHPSNAFIIPVVYFCYPETAYRSLEEIDNIFQKTQRGWRGWFGVVQTAKNEPLRYGKHGELLIDYEATEEHAARSHSIAGQGGKPTVRGVEDVNANALRSRETESVDSSVLEKGSENV